LAIRVSHLQQGKWRCYDLQLQEEYRDQLRHQDVEYDPIDQDDLPF